MLATTCSRNLGLFQSQTAPRDLHLEHLLLSLVHPIVQATPVVLRKLVTPLLFGLSVREAI